MGFRNFFSSFHQGKENSAPSGPENPDVAKSSWEENRQAFLDSLRVDISGTQQPAQNAVSQGTDESEDGRDRGDELTKTREDSLKMDASGQNSEIGTATETGCLSQENENIDTDSMEEEGGISL